MVAPLEQDLFYRCCSVPVEDAVSFVTFNICIYKKPLHFRQIVQYDAQII